MRGGGGAAYTRSNHVLGESGLICGGLIRGVVHLLGKRWAYPWGGGGAYRRRNTVTFKESKIKK